MSAQQASKNRSTEIPSVAEEWKHRNEQVKIRRPRNLDPRTRRSQAPAITAGAIEILDRSCPRHRRWVRLGETAPPCPICERRRLGSGPLAHATLALWATVALLAALLTVLRLA